MYPPLLLSHLGKRGKLFCIAFRNKAAILRKLYANHSPMPTSISHDIPSALMASVNELGGLEGSFMDTPTEPLAQAQAGQTTMSIVVAEIVEEEGEAEPQLVAWRRFSESAPMATRMLWDWAKPPRQAPPKRGREAHCVLHGAGGGGARSEDGREEGRDFRGAAERGRGQAAR